MIYYYNFTGYSTYYVGPYDSHCMGPLSNCLAVYLKYITTNNSNCHVSTTVPAVRRRHLLSECSNYSIHISTEAAQKLIQQKQIYNSAPFPIASR